MTLLVIDGQGGGMGRALIERVKATLPSLNVIAVGTNTVAASAMLKAGADAGASGENAVVYNCRHADIIAGPIGILLANAMHGELTPAMAAAVSESEAQKVLLPVSKCRAYVAGTGDGAPNFYLEDALSAIARLCGE